MELDLQFKERCSVSSAVSPPTRPHFHIRIFLNCSHAATGPQLNICNDKQRLLSIAP